MTSIPEGVGVLCRLYRLAEGRTAEKLLLRDNGDLRGVPRGKLLSTCRDLKRRDWISIEREEPSEVHLRLTCVGLAVAEDLLADDGHDCDAIQRRRWRVGALRRLRESSGDAAGRDTAWSDVVAEEAIPRHEASAILNYWLHSGSVALTQYRGQDPCLLLTLRGDLQDYVIVHELLHFHAPNHGKLWKSLMKAHLGDHEKLKDELQGIEARSRRQSQSRPAAAKKA